jgi:hypothetical protein
VQFGLVVAFQALSPEREPARRRHARVRERDGNSGIGYAAIYDRLPPGPYTIWRNRVTLAATVTSQAVRS